MRSAHRAVKRDYVPGSAVTTRSRIEPLPASRTGTRPSSIRHSGVFARAFAKAAGRLRSGPRSAAARRSFSGKGAVDRLARRGRCRSSSAMSSASLLQPPVSKGGPGSLVPEQGARAHGAFSFYAEGSGVVLHAAKAGRARSSGAHQGIAGAQIWRIRQRSRCLDRKWDAARFISAGFFRAKSA